MVAFLALCILVVSHSAFAQWQCPFDYRCGKRELQDNFGSDVAPQSNRLADRLRFLRNARAKPVAERLPEQERETRAETEGS
ncbi:hypothetical protein ABFA07_004397 [Porites harrisoni]